MKNIWMVLAIAMCGSSSFAQKLSADKVPAAVIAAFNSKMPSATNVSWEKENTSEYEANFKLGKAESSAKFDKDGKWLETETEVPVASLPAAVSSAVATQYAGYKIKEAEEVETPDKGRFYELELSKSGQVTEVRLTADGKVVSSAKEKG